jgi:hypothetical protein
MGGVSLLGLPLVARLVSPLAGEQASAEPAALIVS